MTQTGIAAAHMVEHCPPDFLVLFPFTVAKVDGRILSGSASNLFSVAQVRCLDASRCGKLGE